jgi:hypothetical protein
VHHQRRIGAGLDVGPGARGGIFQPVHGLGVGAGDEDEVRRFARFDRGADLDHHLLARDHRDALRQQAAALGRDLVLEVDAGDAGGLELAHGAHHVHHAAVAGVRVAQQRDFQVPGDAAGVLDHLGHAQHADVGNAQDAGRHGVAGEGDGTEAGLLGDACGEAVEGAGQAHHGAGAKELAQGPSATGKCHGCPRKCR